MAAVRHRKVPLLDFFFFFINFLVNHQIVEVSASPAADKTSVRT